MSAKPAIKELQKELHCIKDKCQDIGIQLGLNDDALSEIENNHPGDTSTQLRHILRLWLARGDASWYGLVSVLKGSIVNSKDLAVKLEAKYCSMVPPHDVLDGQASAETLSPSIPNKDKCSLSDGVGSYGVEHFVREPSLDRLCAGCNRVPKNPVRSHCCNDSVYCQPCSSSRTHCTLHNEEVRYDLDNHLKRKISETTVSCCKCKAWKGQARHLHAHLTTCSANKDTNGEGSSSEWSSRVVQPSCPTPSSPAPSPPLPGEHPTPLADNCSPVPEVQQCVGGLKCPSSLEAEDNRPAKVPRLSIQPEATAAGSKTHRVVANLQEFEEPTSLSEKDLISSPSPAYKCRKCHRIPTKAKKPNCCALMYCEKCASTAKHCPEHDKRFLVNPQYNRDISKMLVRCVNRDRGCLWTKPMNQLKDHLLTSCKIPCPYSSLGCKAFVTNPTIREHMDKESIAHLDLVRLGMNSLSKTITNLEGEVSRLSTPPQLFRMSSVSEHKSAQTGWVSPSFYSHQLGCKLHLLLWFSEAQGVLHLNMVHDEGLYDDTLLWPCTGKITIRIMNQASTGGQMRELKFVLEKRVGSISKHALEMNASFVLNDTLYLRVIHMSLDALSFLYCQRN